MEQIRTLARAIGVKPGKLNKTQLIHNIQRQEGNFDCFGSAANGDCDQHACGWREDCFATATKKPVIVKKPSTKAKPAANKKAAAKPEAKKPVASKKKGVKKKK